MTNQQTDAVKLVAELRDERFIGQERMRYRAANLIERQQIACQQHADNFMAQVDKTLRLRAALQEIEAGARSAGDTYRLLVYIGQVAEAALKGQGDDSH